MLSDIKARGEILKGFGGHWELFWEFWVPMATAQRSFAWNPLYASISGCQDACLSIQKKSGQTIVAATRRRAPPLNCACHWLFFFEPHPHRPAGKHLYPGCVRSPELREGAEWVSHMGCCPSGEGVQQLGGPLGFGQRGLHSGCGFCLF